MENVLKIYVMSTLTVHFVELIIPNVIFVPKITSSLPVSQSPATLSQKIIHVLYLDVNSAKHQQPVKNATIYSTLEMMVFAMKMDVQIIVWLALLIIPAVCA